MSSAVAARREKSVPRVPDSTIVRLECAADETWKQLTGTNAQGRCHRFGRSAYVLSDAIHWLSELPEACIHAIVTDPPYGLIEYSKANMEKKRIGRGGVWRIPPSFDGAKRSPLPRFTVLKPRDVEQLSRFFSSFADQALRVLVPGGHLLVASNPLLSTTTFFSLQRVGFEKRGEIIRLVQTLRGGDRPKGGEKEFSSVSVMPRSCWEPWGIFRKPIQGTVANNLRSWGTGGLRRISAKQPFKDVIRCAPTRPEERGIAPHPSLKPQRFLRKIVRASLPLGIGIIHDPFAGSGSTLAASEALGYRSIGTDHDSEWYAISRAAIPKLATLRVPNS